MVYYNKSMAYDKKKSQQVSVRIPHDLWKDIKAYYFAQSVRRLSPNSMIVTILDKWMIEQMRLGKVQKGALVFRSGDNTPPPQLRKVPGDSSGSD